MLQFYPLKMNLVLEIQKMVIEEIWILCLDLLPFLMIRKLFQKARGTPPPQSLPRLHLSYLITVFRCATLITLLKVTCSTDSKILTGTPNNSQVIPITRPPFIFSPYLLDLFLHMFSFQRSLFTFLVRKRFYYQSSKH